MLQNGPYMLRIDPAEERWELAGDVVFLPDLILRWPYHAFINIAYELIYNYQIELNEDGLPLKLFLCDDAVSRQDGQKVLRLRPVDLFR